MRTDGMMGARRRERGFSNSRHPQPSRYSDTANRVETVLEPHHGGVSLRGPMEQPG